MYSVLCFGPHRVKVIITIIFFLKIFFFSDFYFLYLHLSLFDFCLILYIFPISHIFAIFKFFFATCSLTNIIMSRFSFDAILINFSVRLVTPSIESITIKTPSNSLKSRLISSEKFGTRSVKEVYRVGFVSQILKD